MKAHELIERARVLADTMLPDPEVIEVEECAAQAAEDIVKFWETESSITWFDDLRERCIMAICKRIQESRNFH